jgi:SAM-dependent methyltransferase
VASGEVPDRAWQIFLEVFEALPRQGPGNRASTARALALCSGLPPAPRIADLGCGTGTQTLHLAELTGGRIAALDAERRTVSRLVTRVADGGLSHRVLPVAGDMARPGLAPGGFDLVWSEGAFYNLGIAPALDVCRWLLRPGGCVAFSDAVWRTDAPPPEVQAAFADYPGMGRAEDVVATIAACGFVALGHFTLPDDAWWDDFYAPMLARIARLRAAYAADAAALAVLDEIAREPAMHRRHSSCYAYEFFVARRSSTSSVMSSY